MFHPRDSFRVGPQFQPVMRMLGLDAAGIFSDAQIVCWRKLPNRENCTLDGVVKGRKFAGVRDPLRGLIQTINVTIAREHDLRFAVAHHIGDGRAACDIRHGQRPLDLAGFAVWGCADGIDG